MHDKTAAGTPLGRLTELSSWVREALLTTVLIACLAYPAGIHWFISESGLSELTIFGIGFKTKEVQKNVNEGLEKVNAEVARSTQSGEPPPEARNVPVDPSFRETIKQAERVAPQLLPDAGWVYLGKVDPRKQAWVEGGARTVNATWPISEGARLTVKDDVYVREIGDEAFHSNERIVSVARIGEIITVVEIDYTPARGSGWFVWAKVGLDPGATAARAPDRAQVATPSGETQ